MSDLLTIQTREMTFNSSDIFKAYGVRLSKLNEFKLKDSFKNTKLDKKKDPTLNSMRFTQDFGADELRRFRDFLEELKKDTLNYNFFTLALAVIEDVLKDIPNFKVKARRVKFNNMLTNRLDSLVCFVDVAITYSAKMILLVDGTTGCVSLDKKLQLIDINRSKVAYFAKLWRKGELDETEFSSIYSDLLDVKKHFKTLNISSDELSEMVKEEMLYEYIGAERLDGGIMFLCETLQDKYTSQQKLFESENKKFEKIIDKVIKVK